MASLPISAILPSLINAMAQHPCVILQAPPGAGKSTLLPLTLLRQWPASGLIVMLEPRRLAARNIAHYLAKQLAEPVGQQVGLSMRKEHKSSPQTRLLIVTEGVLTRMLQQDPMLQDVSLIIFDEFHERSLHADLALAFALECQAGLRDDLKILIMSATLEGMDFSAILPNTPIITSEGRSHPITYHYRPINRQQWLIGQIGAVVLEALANEPGNLLVFLPGQGEIERLQQWLSERLDEHTLIAPLYGRLDMRAQQQAIEPPPAPMRKVVLSSNVAQTSLTIEGISVVIDSGLERRALFDYKTATSRLDTRPIAKAAATQRAGRAGRLGPGVCYRLWSQEVHDRLAEQSPPEVLTQELSGLLLETAQWGAKVEDLPLLTTPPAASLARSQQLLTELGALKAGDGLQLSPFGQQMAKLPCHPRFARMLLCAVEFERQGMTGIVADAAYLVALLEDELSSNERLLTLFQRQQSALKQGASRWFKHLNMLAQAPQGQWLGLLCALAWPDRIGKLRSGQRYQLSSGVSADLSDDHPCQGLPELIAVSLGQSERGIKIWLAEPIAFAQLTRYLPELVSERQWFDWDEQAARVRAEVQTRIGELVLNRRPYLALNDEQKGLCLLQGIRQKGLAILPWDERCENLRQRLQCAAHWLSDEHWPAADDGALLQQAKQWLLPALSGMSRLDQLKKLDLYTLLMARLSWPQRQRLEQALPSHFIAPTGTRVPIRYQEGQIPVIPVRIQEMFGQAQTPTIAEGRVALLVELLSPAQRPLQITADLATFWAGSYQQVKKEMKGRYPRHYWPDNPLEAMPTKVTKKKMGLS